MTIKRTIICCTPFTNNKWQWFVPKLNQCHLDWHFYYSTPKNVIEKKIKQPNLAMIHTCFRAVHTARKTGCRLFFSHDPRVTFWCSLWIKIFRVKTTHIAYSFNFPLLPQGFKKTWMSFSFKGVKKFIVYSTMEKQLYHTYFGIPLECIDVSLWGVGVPVVQPQHPLTKGNYICAIGGNARDYETLLEAMRHLPEIKLVLVVRPDNLKGLDVPQNVQTLTNIPKVEAMNILNYSKFMVLPLAGSQVQCGHVTLVAAMHLGKAFIITNSSGVQDYVVNGNNAISCPENDSQALTESIKALWENPSKCDQLGEGGLSFAQANCSEESAIQKLHNLLSEFGHLDDNNSFQ